MEVIQQVLVQIEGSRLGDVRGLLDALEAHRGRLRGQRGFVGMQIARSAEAGGNILLDVQTRWTDNNSLADYTTMPETVVTIVEANGDVIVPGSMAVRRVDAVDAGTPKDMNAVYERFGIALLVPLAIFLIGLGVIYSLSRVYLELDNPDAATALAAVVAISILLGGWYFASNPVPTWQFAGVGVTIIALLLGGTVYAQVSDGPTFAEHVEGGEPGETPEPGESPPPGGPVTVVFEDNFFTTLGDGEQNPTYTVQGAGTEVTLPIQNAGNALHNLHIEPSPGAGFAVSFCTVGGEAPCSDPARMRGGADGTITFTLPAGTYAYRCDFHPTEMVGEIVIE